jgi:ferrous-iron efflux pump FieF
MVRKDEQKKIRAARLSIVAALFLSLLKVGAGLMFRSLGMVSAGVDSLMDLISSSINYFSMKKSVQPADSEHPYGHGKVENIASLFQALLLAIMGLFLIGEGVRQALKVDEIPDIDAGILVMILSGLASYWVGRKLMQVSRETDSPLLEADSYHFTMDTVTNFGVVIALVLAKWSNQVVFDRIVAVLIGLWVIFSAYRIFRSSLDALMDKYIPRHLQEKINQIILSHSPEIMDYHKMRTRRAGSQKLIDLHLVTCRERSLTQAHKITDHIEKEIEKKIKNSDVIIHIEPCAKECPHRIQECQYLCDSDSRTP